jgi:hypothetical protein
MAELLKTNISRKELEDGIIPQNMVLCRAYYSNEGAATKSGIIYGVNKELVYSDSDNVDDDSMHAADLAEVSLEVYKLPETLYFNIDDPDKSMPWETRMELREKDLVWTNTIEALNAVTLVCEGELYKLIPYSDIYVAKREWVIYGDDRGDDNSHHFYRTPGIDVVMINGYVLCEQIHKESLSELDVTSADKIEPGKGKIAYTGTPNKQYLNPQYIDFIDLRVGDEVLFSHRTPPWLLERQKYSSKFSQDKLYWVIQRRNIVAVLNR